MVCLKSLSGSPRIQLKPAATCWVAMDLCGEAESQGVVRMRPSDTSRPIFGCVKVDSAQEWWHWSCGQGKNNHRHRATQLSLFQSLTRLLGKLLIKCITVPGRQQQADSSARCVLWIGRTPVSQDGRVIGSPIRDGTHQSHLSGVRRMPLHQNLTTSSLTPLEFVQTSSRDSKKVCTMGLGRKLTPM